MTPTLTHDLTEVMSTLAAALAAGPASGQRRKRSVIVTSLVEAEMVLDQNELRGCREQKLIVLRPSLFRVQWR